MFIIIMTIGIGIETVNVNNVTWIEKIDMSIVVVNLITIQIVTTITITIIS